MKRYSTWFLIKRLNFNSIKFNLRYFPFKQAIKLPVFLHKNVLLKDLSGKVEIHGNAQSGDIWIGYGDVGIFDITYSRTILEIKGKLIFKGSAFIGQGSRISVGKSGTLAIGDKFKITAESSIICFDEISIGNEVLLSWQVQVMDTDFHRIYNDSNELLNADKPIIINNKVWIGSRCTILKGAELPQGSVVAANSLVSKQLEGNNCLYAGQPAKLLKEDIYWVA